MEIDLASSLVNKRIIPLITKKMFNHTNVPLKCQF